MSNALRNAAESTAHVLSDLVDDARDLVDEARDRIEDLPPLRARRRNNNWRLMIVALVGVGLIVMIIGRRRHREHPEVSDSTAGARLMEKSLEVS
jgi:hypothetical protein